MNVDLLIQTLPKTDRVTRLLENLGINPNLNPPGSKEFDFAINRGASRFPDIREAIGGLDLVRVKTETPYFWKGIVDLPDTSTGVLRRIRCEVQVEGSLPADETKAREFLALALRDKFDFNRVFGRALDAALAACGTTIKGRFVEELRQRQHAVQDELLRAINKEQQQLHAERVELRPTCYDSIAVRDLSDDASGVPFRTKDMLEENFIGFKARLVWSKDDIAHVIARLAYRGSIEGKESKGAPATRLVDGQIEPVEAWFRQLLAEEIGHETLGSILANDRAMLDGLRLRVSERLGRGTGRLVETLVIHLLPGSTPGLTERSLQFSKTYEIAGVGGAELEALHTVRYALEDRDRWRAAGEKEPRDFIRNEVIEATKLFLNDKRFEDIVRLFLDQRKPADESGGQVSALSEAVEQQVGPIARLHGHKIVSTSALLTIPQQAFIDGREIRLDTTKYALAEPYLEPPIQLTATVKIADTNQQNFASALALHKELEQPVKEAIGQVVRTTLRKCSALEYFGSAIVNGLPVQLRHHNSNARPPTASFLPADPSSENISDELQVKLESAVKTELKKLFGLQLIRLDLTPDKNDILITRMRELARRSIDYPAPPKTIETFALSRGQQDFIIRLEARARIFVIEPSQQHWRSFQYSVSRFEDLEEHLNEIRGVLTKALQSLQNELVNKAAENNVVKKDGAAIANPRLSLDDYKAVVRYFTHLVEDQYGLKVRLAPLDLFLFRPKLDVSPDILVDSLHNEIRNKLERRAAVQTSMEREELTEQIAEARRELAQEAKKIEGEISQVEAVQISQDLDTGEIFLPEKLKLVPIDTQRQTHSAMLPGDAVQDANET